MNPLALTRYPQYARQLWWKLRCEVLFQVKNVVRTGTTYCYGIPIVECCKDSAIVLEDRVSLCSDSRHTALGVSKVVILRTLRPQASILVGEESGLSGTTICAAKSVHIGKRCLIGADVIICDTDFHSLAAEGRRYRGEQESAAAPVVIGDDVFIGARAVILKGVTIGQGSVIGAGAIVTKDVPPGVICAGNPAEVIRSLVP